PGVMLRLQPGGADENGNPGGNGTIETRLKRSRSRKVDQHVGVVLIYGECRILRDGGRDGFAHSPVRGDEADPDRLVGGAHAAVSWRKEERRAIARRSLSVNATRSFPEAACPSRDGGRWRAGRYPRCPGACSGRETRWLPSRAGCPRPA